MTTVQIVNMRPLSMGLSETAQAVGLSTSQVQKMVQIGEFPKPRQLSARRVAWVVTEVEAWLLSRPASTCLPPEGCGYGRAGKAAV